MHIVSKPQYGTFAKQVLNIGISGAWGHQRRLWLSILLPASPPEAAIEPGTVGIGTTSPARTLSVSGTAEIVSSTRIGGSGTPSATLDVSGTVKLAGTDNDVCDDQHNGVLRFNNGVLDICLPN